MLRSPGNNKVYERRAIGKRNKSQHIPAKDFTKTMGAGAGSHHLHGLVSGKKPYGVVLVVLVGINRLDIGNAHDSSSRRQAG